jgi:hypothetical protein
VEAVVVVVVVVGGVCNGVYSFGEVDERKCIKKVVMSD